VPRSNDAVEAALLEYAELLSITSSDPYKPRSYEKAARSIGGYHADVATLDAKGILGIPNVGKSIGEKVVEFVTTGRVEALEELREQIPDGVRQMLGVPGLGPKKAHVLYRDLGIASVEQLLDAIDADRLADVKGFGPKTAENIRRSIAQMSASGGRVLVNLALDAAEELLAELRALK
jgi:DNA polymerase (family X)